MPGILIMLPVAVAIALIFVMFFLWSVKNGDFDDLDARGKRLLFDKSEEADTTILPQENKSGITTKQKIKQVEKGSI